MPEQRIAARTSLPSIATAHTERTVRIVSLATLLALAGCSMTGEEKPAEPESNLPPVVVQDIASLGAPAPRHAAPPEEGEAQISSDIPHIVVIRNQGGAIVGTWNAGTGQRGPLVVACFEALQRLRGRERLKQDFPEVCENVPIREIQAG